MSSGGGGTWTRQQDGNEIDIERSSGRGAKWAKSKCRPRSQLERSMGEATKNDGDEDNVFLYLC